LARAEKVEDLVTGYARRQPDPVRLVDGFLARANTSVRALMTEMGEKALADIECFERLARLAETRRDASLHEFQRHRALLDKARREKLIEFWEAQGKMIPPSLSK
jgi:hypothetical protein